uniref:Bromodomain adjacent to zinc finger domain protein 2B n=2 Tax=Lygus hesperus TaxID=30085 RepID=A0A0K8STL3_LYGHE
MEKENASAASEREKDRQAPSLLDPAALFGAFWPRPDGTNSSAANANPLFSAYTGAYGGLLGRAGTPGAGFPAGANPYGTLSVAASQASALGINPASMGAWWSMAQQLAAQDYLAQLQFANMLPPYPMIPTPPHLSSNKTSHSKNSSSSSSSTTPSTTVSVPTTSQPTSTRLPPDTEIIKYTSSMVGPKIPGTTNRGRKKTISLDHPHHLNSLKHRSHSNELLKTPYVGLDLSGKSKDAASVEDSFYRYGSDKSDRLDAVKSGQTNGRSSPPVAAEDGPLNLSLKPDVSANHNNNNSALQSLSALSQTLGQAERVDRRKPGPKPRRVPPFAPSDSSHPSSGSEENDSVTLPHKDGRPRNLGRGISKPKKNTVASLLAQSRALGIKPGLEVSQLAALARATSTFESLGLPEKDKEESSISSSPNSLHDQLQPLPLNLNRSFDDHKQTSYDGISEDSHSDMTDSSYDSDGDSHSRKRDRDSMSNDGGPGGKRRKVVIDEGKLREALAKGWKRETYITSVGRAGVKGEVVYTSPCGRTFRHFSDLVRFLDKQGSDLTREHFSFSCRILLGDYIESEQGKEPIRLSEGTLALKLQEMVAQHRAALDLNKQERDRMALAAKEAKRLAREEAAKQKEQLRLLKEQERNERQEQARKEREQRNQQLLEARKKKQEELERQRIEGQQRKQQERELKRQQAAIIKEQERERRRQHMALVKALEVRKRMEEREKKRLEQRAEKLATREKRIEQRKVEVELLRELRKPVEDMELSDPKPIPELPRIPGLKLTGQAFADALMVHEFLRNFGETLGFDMESLPTLNSLQEALLNESEEAEEELMSVITQLVICGIEDPGIPQPARHTTLLNHSLKAADITHNSLSEILRIYLYANATGEVKATTGVHFEREKEKRVTEHHNNMEDMADEMMGKNSAFFALLKENQTFKMSEWLKKRPFLSLNPTKKAAILAFLCHELLQNKAVIRQIDSAIDTVAQLKRERWPLEANLRKLKHIQARRNKAMGVQCTKDGETQADDEAEVESCNESDITQPEEVTPHDMHDELSKINIGETLAVVSKQAEVNTKALADYSGQLRATCLGQDRYCRRYWCLSTGIYVEGMESADPELFFAPDPEPIEEEPLPKKVEVKDEGTGVMEIDEEQPPPPPAKTPETNGTLDSPEPPVIKTEMRDSYVQVKDDGQQTELSLKDDGQQTELMLKDFSTPIKEEDSKDALSEKSLTPKSLQFERLGECMEKESNAVNGCISMNSSHHEEHVQWFSILPKDPCDSTSITNSQPGYRCWAETGGELRIPQPGMYTGSPSPCPSPLPLPLSAEEAALLEQCRLHGLPKPGRPKPIPPDYKKGWWKITEETMKNILSKLEPRGVREREFLANITRLRTDHTWESTLKASTSGDPNKGHFKINDGDENIVIPAPDDPEDWDEETALRIDMAALIAVEALEEKVASASMQLKGWKMPGKVTTCDISFKPACVASDPSVNPIAVAKERLGNLFENIEKRYLKPPLGTNMGDLKLNQAANNTASTDDSEGGNRECKGLVVWKEALHKSQTAAQLSMVQQALEASIAWDKSIMKANCQFCHSGDNEDKLLLCDGCDKGYHTYCFKPKMDNIPEGDWYCHQCLNKAKGEKNCLVCGKKVGRNLLACEACPVAYHTDCMTPPLSKVPRGKWYCSNCASKHVKKKSTRRSQTISSPTPIKTEEINNSSENLNVGGGGTGEEESAGPAASVPPPAAPKPREKTGKRLNKEMAACKQVLDDLESHDEAWPFLLAVNTKQFPTYKKIIRNPMDLQTIGKRLSHNEYKSRDDFVSDVRLIFDNCETFNEDNSPVGKAGHTLRLFFETRWAELTSAKPSAV